MKLPCSILTKIEVLTETKPDIEVDMERNQKTNRFAIRLPSFSSFVFPALSWLVSVFFLFFLNLLCYVVCVCVFAGNGNCDRRANKIQMCGDCRNARTVASSYECQMEPESKKLTK